MSRLLDRLSNDLALPPTDLLYLIKSAPYRYKVYEIAKKAPGKKRTIAQPAREVKPLQYWVMKNVLAAFPIHPSAVAYRKGKSILDNAAPHAAHAFLCKLDFKNFFPSIKSSDFEKFMHFNPLASVWTKEEIGHLSRILFWRKKRGNVLQLSIGAPSSPLLSNILLYAFDVAMNAFCSGADITYTRYADDLSFSTNTQGALSQMEERVMEICKEIRSPKLMLNEGKTVHASKRGLRRVTGLVLTNDGLVSLGRERKRAIRARFHRYMLGQLSGAEIAELAGMLSFIRSVEPLFLQRLAKTYGANALEHLIQTRSRLR
ncbi:retron St85 family RNA-directed DNA polymerase [Tunturiibacter psychrotolerans]|uniref:retron St85 family RNA-directed DNA polymerase n=1 Tax=Tunturiibacter psychrotolerans TaxID=3069686 RepID=UPI003D1C3D0A